MRTPGAALVGLVGGLLAGFLTQEVVARLVLFGAGQFPDSTAPALFLSFFAPTLAVAGAVAVPVIDAKTRRR